MGAWAEDALGNDVACDWAAEFAAGGDLNAVSAKLAEVESVGDAYLDADLASEALAACEVIARLKGQWGLRNAYSEELDKWVLNHPAEPSDELVRLAVLAIDRITAGQSELAELWDESDHAGAWRNSVAELRARVTARP